MSQRFLLFLALASGLVGTTLSNPALCRPYTVDDVLRMEDVGRMLYSAPARSILYEYIEPYERAPNLGVLYLQEDRSPLSKIFVIDSTGSRTPQPLFAQAPDAGYWIGGLSPDGTMLAVYRLCDGKLRAGVYDLLRRKLRFFRFTPNYFWLQQRPVWLSNDELVYAALPPDDQPSIVYKPGIANRLSRLWARSFEGKVPSVTVISSTRAGTHMADQFRPGALLRVDARTGRTRTLGRGYFYNLRLSPDRRYLAALKEGGPIQPDPSAPLVTFNNVRRQLVVFDLRSFAAEAEPCPACDVSLGSLEWSAEGDSLTFFARTVGEPLERGRYMRYAPSRQSLVSIETGGLAVLRDRVLPTPRPAVSIAGRLALYTRPVGKEPGTYGSSGVTSGGPIREDWYLVSDDGRSTNLTAAFKTVSETLAAVRPDGLFVLADGELWRLLPNGQRENLTSERLANVSIWTEKVYADTTPEESLRTGMLLPRSQAILESAGRVFAVDLSTGIDYAFKRPGNARLVFLNMDHEVAVFREDGDRGTVFTLYSGANGPSAEILRLNRHLAAVDPASRVDLEYDFRGSKLSSCALLPPGWNPSRPYPAVVNVYPAPLPRCVLTDVGEFYPYNLQLLAAQGYVVLFPSVPRHLLGTPGDPTANLTALVLAAIDAAIDAGYIDPDRIGIFGLSQGHHAALRVLTETGRFRAGVVSHGISNTASHYGTTPLYARLGSDSFGVGNAGRYESPLSPNYLGVPPWEDPSRYVRSSPVFFANRIDAPLLIMHSDMDQFPLGQSEEIFAALYRLRKPATYVTYWGEGHGNLSPANIRDMWARIVAWYDEHLRSSEPPSDSGGSGQPSPSTIAQVDADSG